MQSLTLLLVLATQLIVAKDLRLLSYAALGDSYAAGDGAGSSRLLPHFDLTCGRFSDSYPYQLLNSDELDLSQHWPGFEYKACGGATVASVSLDQKYTFRHKDIVTVQVGGNEVDFFPILNECIQQWHPLSSCPHELERARALVQDPGFAQRYRAMVEDILRWQQDTTLFTLGYARFFNAQTSRCNKVSFSASNPANVLSNELRRELNALVHLLNCVIRDSAEAAGAVYVDVDKLFEGHRFCEEGVREPKEDWEGTWFFRSTESTRARQVVMRNPFSKFEGLTRTFHPTANGHAAIAQEIVRLYQVVNPDS